MKPPAWLPIYCRLAGSADAVTGLLLVTVPATTLRLMGVGAMVADPTWVRWVGVFVAAVGLAYWLPDLPGSVELRWQRRVAALELTTLVRLVVASFVAWCLLTGRLEPAFVSVLATDLGLGVFQLLLLRGLYAAHRAGAP